jgi:hypothetical protein
MHCECNSENCAEELPLTNEEYIQLSTPSYYIVLAGHEGPQDKVIQRLPDKGVLIVEEKELEN